MRLLNGQPVTYPLQNCVSIMQLVGRMAQLAGSTQRAKPLHVPRAELLLHVTILARRPEGTEPSLVRSALRRALIRMDVAIKALGIRALPKALIISALRDETINKFVKENTIFTVDTSASKPMPAHLQMHHL